MDTEAFNQKLQEITPKPREVLDLFLQGKTDHEISEMIHAEVTTVRKHIENLCTHFGLEKEVNGVKKKRRDELLKLFAQHLPDLLPDKLPYLISSKKEENEKKESWEEELDISGFLGREEEVKQLMDCILTHRCRVVAINGFPGIGKTLLASKITQEIKENFDKLIWRSLDENKSFATVLKDLIDFLDPEKLDAIHIEEKNVHEDYTQYMNQANAAIDVLLDCLRQSQHLLIFDNWDRIMIKGDFAGDYELRHKPYGRLLRRLGEEIHESCVLILSREKPREINFLEGSDAVRSISLSGLEKGDVVKFLEKMGIKSEFATIQRLSYQYNGNPLALRLIASLIKDVWGGDIAAFLKQDSITAIIQTFRNLVEGQLDRINRINNSEKYILYELAIAGKEKSLLELQKKYHNFDEADLAKAIKSLLDRSLTERTKGNFTIHPVIQECVIRELGKQVAEEILHNEQEKSEEWILNSLYDFTQLPPSQISLIRRQFLKKRKSSEWIKSIKQMILNVEEDSVKRNLEVLLQELDKN